MRFDGVDIVPDRDTERLENQLCRIWDVVKYGQWMTLEDIAQMTGDPQASISAQLRNLRKARFGGHAVERRYIHDGLYEYKVVRSRR